MVEFKPVVFKIGNEEYGVDINLVCGIEKVLPIVPIHNVNNNIKGIINLRGNVIPIYSLRRKFGMPDINYSEDTKFILVKTENFIIGLEVDMVGDIQNVKEDNIYDVPKILITQDTGYYDRILNVGGRIVVMLNVAELMNEEETEELNKAMKSDK